MNRGLAVLIALTVIPDMWRIYLKIRNLLGIHRMKDAPFGLHDFITEEDYGKFRKSQFESDFLHTASIVFGLCIKLFKVATRYDRFIWDSTAAYNTSLSLRAVLHTTCDRFVSECAEAPLAAYATWRRATRQINIGEAFMQSMTDVALGTACAASISFGCIQLTDAFGVMAFPVLIAVASCLGIYMFILYITTVLPLIASPLENNEVGRNLTVMAEKLGYPHEKIRITVTATGSKKHDDIHYYSMLGYDMLIVARRLLRILAPVQVTALVTHELARWKLRHRRSSYLFGLAEISGYCCALMLCYGNEGINKLFGFSKTKPQPYIPSYLATQYIWPMVDMLIRGAQSVVERQHVFQADDYASDQGLAAPLRSGLLVTAASFKTLPIFDSWHSTWFKGQPTITERVARLNRRIPRVKVTFSSITSDVHSPLGSFDFEDNVKTPHQEATEHSEHSGATEEPSNESESTHTTEEENIQMVPAIKHTNVASEFEGSTALRANPSEFALHGRKPRESTDSKQSNNAEESNHSAKWKRPRKIAKILGSKQSKKRKGSNEND